jgi:hypothetical protein
MLTLALLAVLGAIPPAAPGHRRAPAALGQARPQLILGVDKSIDLAIVVRDNDGEGGVAFAPERALASVGAITSVTPTGRDRFTAHYLAPAARFPQVAIVVVDLVGGGQHLRATTRIALAATTEMPFRTSPNASVSVRVEDRTFGPARADAQGNVAIPIVVPPGVRDGLARATDPSGSTRETLVYLQPTPFTQLMIVTAPQFEVGSFAEVSTFAVTPRGEPAPAGTTTLRASDGMVHPLGSGTEGEERFLVEAPRRVGPGAVSLVATGFNVGPEPVLVLESHVEITVPLVAGPAQRVLLSSSTDRLIIGDDTAAIVTVAARDRNDNPTSCAGMRLLVDHQAAALLPDGQGCGRLTIRAPPAPMPDGGVEIEARLGGALSARTFIRATSGPPVRLAASVSAPEVVGDGHRSVEVRVDSFDRTGRPTPVSNLHWQTAGGHLGQVRARRVGSYVIQFTPNPTQTARTEVLVVKGDPSLSATTTLRVEPQRSRLSLAARVGMFTNLGGMAGPIATIEGLQSLPGRAAAWAAGLMVSVLHNDVSATAGGGIGLPDTVLEIDQIPCLAIAQYRLPLPLGVNISVGGGMGLSFARTVIRSNRDSWPTGRGNARAVAAEARTDVGFPLAVGQLVVGARYLWIDLGRTSQGDEIDGNSAGFIGDAGYRMAW